MKTLVPLIAVLFLSGCEKKDTMAPVISMSSPENDQVFIYGQTVTVKATITDNQDIHMIHLIVTDNLGGHLVHFEEHWDGKTYELNKSFPTQAARTYTIHIDAADHSDNITNKDLTVSAN